MTSWQPTSQLAPTLPGPTATQFLLLTHLAVLLLGCGARMVLVPPALREALRAAGVVIEPMDTGGACRTYNVLLAEDRQVAAALLPVA